MTRMVNIHCPTHRDMALPTLCRPATERWHNPPATAFSGQIAVNRDVNNRWKVCQQAGERKVKRLFAELKITPTEACNEHYK